MKAGAKESGENRESDGEARKFNYTLTLCIVATAHIVLHPKNGSLTVAKSLP